jgi:hypothetical protein
VIVRHEDQSYTGRIRNISSTGAHIEGLWNVPEGTLFAIEFSEQDSVNAIARWSQEDRMGVEFTQSVDLVRLRTSPPRSLAS